VAASKEILLACIAIAALLGCKKSEKREADNSASGQPSQSVDGHQTGLVNAKAMIDNAERCEPKSGTGEVAACQRACELNHSNSCANWGQFFEVTNRERAHMLYDRSCTGGSGIGCEALARMSQKDGATESEAQFLSARRYHRVHCSQGYGRSCSQLATLLEQGRGGVVDTATGRSYRQRACLLGVSSDC
jgi:hypothetical protein